MIRPEASRYFSDLESALSIHTKQGGIPEPTGRDYSSLKYNIEPLETFPPQLEVVWGDDEKHIWSDFQHRASEVAEDILEQDKHMIITVTDRVTLTKSLDATVLTSLITQQATQVITVSDKERLVYQDKETREPKPPIMVQITTNVGTIAAQATPKATSTDSFKGLVPNDGARVRMDVFAVGVCLVAILVAIAIL